MRYLGYKGYCDIQSCIRYLIIYIIKKGLMLEGPVGHEIHCLPRFHYDYFFRGRESGGDYNTSFQDGSQSPKRTNITNVANEVNN